MLAPIIFLQDRYLHQLQDRALKLETLGWISISRSVALSCSSICTRIAVMPGNFAHRVLVGSILVFLFNMFAM